MSDIRTIDADNETLDFILRALHGAQLGGTASELHRLLALHDKAIHAVQGARAVRLSVEDETDATD